MRILSFLYRMLKKRIPDFKVYNIQQEMFNNHMITAINLFRHKIDFYH